MNRNKAKQKKKAKKDCKNKNLPRKYERWMEANFSRAFSLILATAFPIDRERLKKYAFILAIEEAGDGFRVLFSEAVLVKTLPKYTTDWASRLVQIDAVNQAMSFTIFQ
jgi:hypothetical protein